MSLARKVVRNVLSNWAGFVVNLAVAFVLSPIVVHSLGDSSYGIWAILIQFTGYLGILELGVRSSVVKWIATYHAEGAHDRINEIVSGALAMYSVVAVVSLLVTAVMVVVFPRLFDIGEVPIETVRTVIALGGVTVAQGFIFNVFYGVLMGLQRYDVFNRLSIVMAVIRFGVTVWALEAGYGLVALAAIQLGVSLPANFAAAWLCRRAVPQLRLGPGRVGREVFRRIVSYSAASFFVNVSQKIVYQTDAFVIGAAINAAAVTFYAIPTTLVEYMRRFVIAMTETFVPLTSELRARGDMASIQSLLVRGTRMAILIGMPIFVVLMVSGERFISLWMGPSYGARGARALQWLALAQLLSMSHLASREVFNGLAQHRLNAYTYGAEAVANLTLSIALVFPWGIDGVAIGTAVPHIVMVLAVFPWLVSRVTGLSWATYLFRVIVPPLLLAIPFGLLVWWVDARWPARSILTYALQSGLLAAVFVPAAWRLVFPVEERRQHVAMLASRFKRNPPKTPPAASGSDTPAGKPPAAVGPVAR